MNSNDIEALMHALPTPRNVYSLREWLRRSGANAELVRAVVKVVKCSDVPDPEARSQATNKIKRAIMYDCRNVPDEAVE